MDQTLPILIQTKKLHIAAISASVPEEEGEGERGGKEKGFL